MKAAAVSPRSGATIASAASVPPTASASTADQTVWVVGTCWLWCEGAPTLVTWIGPAAFAGHSVPMYACSGCLGYLGQQIVAAAIRKDSGVCTGDLAVPHPARRALARARQGGRHRRRPL